MRKRHQIIEDEEDDESIRPRKSKSPRLEAASRLGRSQQIDEPNSTRGIPDDKEIGIVAGRISKVELENFMCHGNLAVPFNVHSNNCFYIGGPNGSGKSALFSAINIGLGGVGRNNDRGNSVKTYIKNGKQSAKIRVTLTNTGDGRADYIEDKELGDYVTIERNLTQTGGGYVLKTTQGAGRGRTESVVSTKKRHIDILLARYGIELANPIYWLSQDRARSFLAATDSHKMFQIFMEASGLEDTQNNYDIIKGHLHVVETNLQAIHKSLIEQRKEYQRMLDIRQQSEQQEQKKSELSQLQWYLAYAPLRDAYDKESNMKIQINTYSVRIRELKEKITQYAEKIRDSREELNNMANTVGEAVKRAEAMRKHEQDYRDEMMPFEMEDKSLKTDIKEEMRRLQMCEEEIDKSKVSIANEQRRIAEDASRKEKESLERQLNADTEQERQLISKKQELQEKKEEIKETVKNYQQQRETANTQRQRTLAQKDYFAREVKKLEDVQKNQELRFGPDTIKINDLIKKYAHEFKNGIPKGPAGKYITVRDTDWIFAVEVALKEKLFAYIFNSERDQAFFRQLINRYGYHMPQTAITGSFGYGRYDTRTREPASKYQTVLSIIDVPDNDIANYLIDTSGIESIILIKNDQEARDLMNGYCPNNVRTAFTMNGSQVFGSNGRSGQYRFYQNNMREGLNVLSKVDPAQIRKMKQESEIAEEQYKQHEEAYNRFSRSIDDAMARYRRFDKESMDCDNDLIRLRTDIKKYNRMLAKLEDREDGDDVITANQNAIEKFEEVANKHKQSLAEKDSKLEILKKKLSKMNRQLEQFKNEAAAATKSNQDHSDASDMINQKIRDLSNANRLHEETMQNLIEKKEEYENIERIAVLKEIEEAEKHAESQKDVHKKDTVPDFKTIPATDDLHSMVKQKNNELEAIEKALGTELPSDDELRKKKNFYKIARSLLTELKDAHECLLRCYTIRAKKFPVIQHAIIMRVKSEFQRLIKFKFEGEMVVNPTKQEIRIKVRPHSHNHDDILKDIKGLSGGERSYTTTCFFMALWDIMETPFRCMDEFDVFMDGHMRKTAMDLIVKLATEHYAHQQFIFFTPQGINELKIGDRVATFEMPEVRET